MIKKRSLVSICVVLFLCSSLLTLKIHSQEKESDFFAKIGNKVQNKRMSLLEEKKPPMLSEIYLPISNGKKNAFKEVKEISTKAELDKELVHLKNKFLPFMAQMAPELKSYRERIYLKEFQWRIETENDQKKFIETLKGGGNWETVSVPHFGAPVGRAVTYYYKKVVITEKMLKDKALFIHFKGVDYKGQVFLNGAFVGSHEGFFAPFEFNISKYAKEGENQLLVKVENDYTTTGFVAPGKGQKFGDKIYGVTGLGYDNFYDGGHQCAAGMGIYQDCYIESRDPVHVNDVFVRPNYNTGEAEIRLEINNYNEDSKPVSFNISLFGQNFKSPKIIDTLIVPTVMHVPGIGDLQKPTDWKKSKVELGYGVNFFKYKIKIPNFKSWSNETPWLYQLQVKVLDKNKQITDTKKQTFGMRSFTMDTVSIPKGQLYFNNKKIRLRGANTMGFLQQDVYKKDWNQLIEDILLAKASNMNFLRTTQRLVQPEIYDYADQLGLMLQTDFPTFGGIRYNKWEESVRQASEMERLVRNHPSTILVTYINERFPNGEGHPHRNMAEAEQYFSLFRAMDEAVHKENPDRVIKIGDGDYDPPTPGLPDNHCYNTWYNGHGLSIGKMHKGYWQWVKPDWYYGCGEFGAEALDPVETMYKYYPKEWLPKDKEDDKNWTANRIFAAQTHKFHYMWYNTQHSLKDWVDASQDHQAWALKTVTEAFRRDNNMITFAVHLFIDAWPAGWMKTIMDVDRNPKKAFFSYRDALKPIIVTSRSDRKHFFSEESIKVESWISNDLNKNPKNYTLKYQFEQKGKIYLSGSIKANVPSNSSAFQGYISFDAPKVKKRTSYILRTAVFNEKGQSVDQSEMVIDVFPKNKLEKEIKKVAFLGDGNGVTNYLKKNLILTDTSQWQKADVIWINDFKQYQKHKVALDKLVELGKKVILYNIPVGNHQIASTKVTVQNTTMGSYNFVSPKTGHIMTKNVQPFDFKMWYDEDAEYITPFLDKIVLSNNLKPILGSGNTNWLEDQGTAMAAGSINVGKGQIIISQIDLLNRIKTNPTARNFVINLLTK
ncbi:glycoside hydrolase family 2 protein [Polaribacter atrinae]|mgnify:CR=1 FL=1|uniref:glycoside hydrolase family 2 protein n=1 Tax=Polaribacter atrinae TaxID=1333662 RepID=UPI0030F788B0